ncbi:MAG: hypothetical protein GXO77_04695 [Calditrichaeota bacterium]|nr:hypothetical protein [Calditrichota bacterium]
MNNIKKSSRSIRLFCAVLTSLTISVLTIGCSEKSNPLTAGDIARKLFNVEFQWNRAKAVLSGFFDNELSLKPGVVLISYDKPEVADEIEKLPSWILPHNDEEVKTVILINKIRKEVGYYGFDPDYKAYKIIWHVWAVNINENKVWEETFYGGDPPEQVGLNVDEKGRTGSEPVNAFIDWILKNCENN